MKTKPKRFGNRFVVILSLLSILGIIFSIIEFRRSLKEVQLEHFHEIMKSSARNKLEDMNHQINEEVGALEKLAMVINRYDDLDHPDVQKIIEIANEINRFDYTGIVDTEGNGYDNDGNVVTISDRTYFQEAMEGRVAFSEVLDSKVFEGRRVQIIAHPLRTVDREVRAVVYGVMDIVKLEKQISNDEPINKGALYIVDSCGAYIGRFQKNNAAGSDANFWKDLKACDVNSETLDRVRGDFDARQEGEFTYFYDGEAYYACYMPIGPNKWQLVYSFPDSCADEILHSLYILDTRNTIFATCCQVVLLLCIVWYVKRSSDSIQRAHRQAQKNMQYLQLALEHSKNTVFEYNQRLKVIRLRSAARSPLLPCTVMTYVPDSLISMNMITPDSIPAIERLFQNIKVQCSCEEDIEIISDGKEIWYRISMNNIYDEQGAIIDTVGILVDITEQKKQELEIKRKLQIQDALISNALIYAKVDLTAGVLTELNGNVIQIPFAQFMATNVQTKVSEKQFAFVEQKLSLDTLNGVYQQGKESFEMQFRMRCDGIYKWVSCMVYFMHKEKKPAVLIVVTDIDEKKRREIALQEKAERDGLTGLYNAATARSKINEILVSNRVMQESCVFALLDLDNYKQINDTFGHSYGDQVLIDVANILNTRFRSSDIVARLGGDEFIVLLRNMKSYEYAECLIEELCQSIHKTYRVGNQEVTLSASIGIAVAPTDGNTFAELYQKSDIAQYQIKKDGKNGFKRYQETSEETD